MSQNAPPVAVAMADLKMWGKVASCLASHRLALRRATFLVRGERSSWGLSSNDLFRLPQMANGCWRQV